MNEVGSRRALGFAAASVLVAGVLSLGLVGAADAQGSGTVTVEPSSGVTDGQSVTVTASGLSQADGAQVAVTQCGNADSSGAPLSGTEPTEQDCFGIEAVGTPNLVLISVSGGSVTTPYPVATSGIGVNGASCIPASEANFSCVIAVADVATQGNELRLAAPFDVGSGGSADTTDTTAATGDTTATTTPAVDTEVLGATETAPEALATTGFATVPMVLGGLAVLNVGYLALSATRPSRRRR